MKNIRLDLKKYTLFVITIAIIYEPIKLYLKNYYMDNIVLNYIRDNIILIGFGLIIKVHDLWLWKYKNSCFQSFLRLIGFDSIPDISREWEVELMTTYNNKKFKGIANIKQTYSTLKVNIKFSKSSSNNINYLLNKRDDNNWHLTYEYENRPKDLNLIKCPKGGNHKGYFSCIIKDNLEELEGWYSNDVSRGTAGTIFLKRSNLK